MDKRKIIYMFPRKEIENRRLRGRYANKLIGWSIEIHQREI